MKLFECNCPEGTPQILHAAEIAKYNSYWHREKFKETGDRYHLGQWKAYSRVFKRLRSFEDGSTTQQKKIR